MWKWINKQRYFRCRSETVEREKKNTICWTGWTSVFEEERRGAGVHVLYRAEAREMSRLLIHRV